MSEDKVIKKTPFFNNKGELKGTIDEVESPSPFYQLFTFDVVDKEGEDLAAKKMIEMFKEQREYMKGLTYPEKLRVYGHTFETLAEEYQRAMNHNVELMRRLRFMNRWRDERKGPSFCECSAMVWDSEDEGFLVPYLYCVIKEGSERFTSEIPSLCAACNSTPCDHFFDPTHKTSDCIDTDYVKRESQKYPSIPCIYANPSDEDIDIALRYHEEEFGLEVTEE